MTLHRHDFLFITLKSDDSSHVYVEPGFYCPKTFVSLKDLLGSLVRGFYVESKRIHTPIEI